MSTSNYDKKLYEKDFPDNISDWKWRIARLYPKDKYIRQEIVGVVLHDGKFVTNGILFEKNEFKIIGKWPPRITWLHTLYWKTFKKLFSKIHLWCWVAPTLYVRCYISDKKRKEQAK
jgi:hypothetical protein